MALSQVVKGSKAGKHVDDAHCISPLLLFSLFILFHFFPFSCSSLFSPSSISPPTLPPASPSFLPPTDALPFSFSFLSSSGFYCSCFYRPLCPSHWSPSSFSHHRPTPPPPDPPFFAIQDESGILTGPSSSAHSRQSDLI